MSGEGTLEFAHAEADMIASYPDTVAAAAVAADSSHWRAEAMGSLEMAQQVVLKEGDVVAGSAVAAAWDVHIGAGLATLYARPAMVAAKTYLVEEAR